MQSPTSETCSVTRMLLAEVKLAHQTCVLRRRSGEPASFHSPPLFVCAVQEIRVFSAHVVVQRNGAADAA
jgi:hypothetical protein